MIKLTIEKVADYLSGEKMFKLKKVNGMLDYYSLPSKVRKEKHCYYENGRIICANGSHVDYSWSEGCLISEKNFKAIINYIKECGEILHSYNIEFKKMKEEWNGTFEVKI